MAGFIACDEYSKSLEKEFKAEGAFVGLNGLLFVKRAKDKMASIGLDVGGKDLHLLLAKKARTRRANVDQVGKSIPRRRTDHTSEQKARQLVEDLLRNKVWPNKIYLKNFELLPILSLHTIGFKDERRDYEFEKYEYRESGWPRLYDNWVIGFGDGVDCSVPSQRDG
ncbi:MULTISPECIES: hypothetical protein [Pseudomonas putida group]|uniref:hypothetical protein n=1 Tax=Pseudomonas putida group TaxID=136845 RepID=UPI0015559816|nr:MULTISPECIES: hypothetical protein [Pseudomonas putida group]